MKRPKEDHAASNLAAARIIRDRGTDAPESIAARWAAIVLAEAAKRAKDENNL